jgi:hypothetical protein
MLTSGPVKRTAVMKLLTYPCSYVTYVRIFVYIPVIAVFSFYRLL